MITIQYLGQNCFLFNIGSICIISDPFYNYGKAMSNFKIEKQSINYILLTHAHGDHIADVGDVLKHYPNSKIIGVPEVCAYYKDIESIDFSIGGTIKISNINISMVKADHTSAFPDGTYGGNPVGYIINSENKNIYLAGDTGIMLDMKLFPEIYGKIDLAILPVGGHYTMDSAMAAFAASELLKTPQVIGCHFDTFPPIKVNHEEVKSDFDKREIKFTLPNLGEIITI